MPITAEDTYRAWRSYERQFSGVVIPPRARIDGELDRAREMSAGTFGPNLIEVLSGGIPGRGQAFTTAERQQLIDQLRGFARDRGTSPDMRRALEAIATAMHQDLNDRDTRHQPGHHLRQLLENGVPAAGALAALSAQDIHNTLAGMLAKSVNGVDFINSSGVPATSLPVDDQGRVIPRPARIIGELGPNTPGEPTPGLGAPRAGIA